MNPQILKTIELIKKSYDQPLLFHLLHGHLTYLLLKTTPAYEITDDWSKILILSCHIHKTPNQGLEVKLQQYLKKLRPPFDNEKKLKCMIICYYLLNRSSSMINHILLFELISQFMGVSDYFDGLILRIFSHVLISKIYTLESNKKLKDDTIQRMQETIKSKGLSDINKIKSLVCFISGSVEPFCLDFINISSSYYTFKTLEIICLYAKYTEDTSFIKNILPNDELFVQGLEQFMKLEYNFESSEMMPIVNCCLMDDKIFDLIKDEYNRSNDKEKFVSKLLEFIYNLKC